MQSPSLVPPAKKRLSSLSPAPPQTDHLSMQVDNSISRRRAQLELLKQQSKGTLFAGGSASLRPPNDHAPIMMPGQGPPPRNSAAPPMLGDGHPAPPMQNGRPSAAPASAPLPPIPLPTAMDDHGRRNSDIFPGVEKVVDSTAQSQPPTPPPPGSSPHVRRLDSSFDKKNPPPPPSRSRSKSAPPSRPPPPRGTSLKAAETPEKTNNPPPPSSQKSKPPPPPPPSTSISAPSSPYGSSTRETTSVSLNSLSPGSALSTPSRVTKVMELLPRSSPVPPPPPPSLTSTSSHSLSNFSASGRGHASNTLLQQAVAPPPTPPPNMNAQSVTINVQNAGSKAGLDPSVVGPLQSVPSSPGISGKVSVAPPPMRTPPKSTQKPPLPAPVTSTKGKNNLPPPPISMSPVPQKPKVASFAATPELAVEIAVKPPSTTMPPPPPSLLSSSPIPQKPKVASFAATPELAVEIAVQPPPTMMSPDQFVQPLRHAGHTPYPPNVASFADTPNFAVDDGRPPPVTSPVDSAMQPPNQQLYVGHTPHYRNFNVPPPVPDDTPEEFPESSSNFYSHKPDFDLEDTPEEIRTASHHRAGHTPYHPNVQLLNGDTPVSHDNNHFYDVNTPVFHHANNDFDQSTPFVPSNLHNVMVDTTEVDRDVGENIPFSKNALRLDTFREMCDSAPTPEALKNERESVELRMEKHMAQLEREKADALQLVAQLQNELADLKREELLDSSPQPDLYAFIQLLDAEGVTAAVEWAREQVHVVNGKGVNFSPNGPELPQIVTSPPCRRSTLALPLREHEEIDLNTLKQAVESLDFEYRTDLAFYTVRRPYGIADEIDLWFGAGQLNAKLYAKDSFVEDHSSIEVVAHIETDNSFFVVYGDAYARHQGADGVWTEFGNVYEREFGLGDVRYIDSEENEAAYSLDAVFEAAAAIRVNYCSSVRALALGLKARGMQEQMMTVEEHSVLVKETADAKVGTEDIPFPSVVPAASKAITAERKPFFLWTLIRFFFSSIFSLVWTFFVRFPLAVLWRASAHLCAFTLLATLHMYWKEKHYSEMGYYPDYSWNSPGIR